MKKEMKNEKSALTALQQFHIEVSSAMTHYYRQSLSESIKRGIARKKLSTSAKLRCKEL